MASVAMTFDNIKIWNALCNPLLILAIILPIHFILPSSNLFLLIIRLSMGIFALLYIPGYCLVTCFFPKSNFKNFGFYLIFGFLYQLLSIFAIWFAGLFFKPLNFILLVYLSTLLLVSTLILYAYKVKGQIISLKSLGNHFDAIDHVLLTVLALFLAISLYYQQFSLSPHSDGAAYLDFARNIVQKGVFTSNMILPSWSYQNIEWTAGYHSYIFGISAIALFFLLGNVSLLYAKIMLIFAGSMSIFLVYHICNELLDQGTARISAFLVAISPIFLTHTSLVGGPEITSLLFVLLFMYLSVLSLKYPDSLLIPLLAGVSFFVAWYAWRFNFVVIVLGVLPSLFLYLSLKYKELNLRNLLLFSILWLSFLIEYRFSINWTLTLVGVSFPTAILAAAFIVRRFHKSAVMKVFLVVILTTYALLFFRHTSAIITGMPLLRQTFVGSNVYSANVEVTLGLLNRMLNINMITRNSRMYWDGLCSALGQATVFFGIASLIKFRKIKETLLLCSFPFFQWLIWSLMVTVNFQPRYIISASVFWMMLVALSITMLISTISSPKLTEIHVLLTLNKFKRYVSLDVIVRFIAVTLLLFNLMLFWYPIYNNMRVHILGSWNYPSKFDWLNAFEWIRNNTSVDDVIAVRFGNYFAWYTNRQTLGLFTSIYPSNFSYSDLISLIREFKVKYLIIDYSFASCFASLKWLYYNPKAFYGAEIVFNRQGDKGPEVIIYNVTNIAYGEPVKETRIISNCEDVTGWLPQTYYGNGTIILESQNKVEGNFSIKVTFTPIERPLPQASVIFNPVFPLNLSRIGYIEFWVKIPRCKDISITLMTDIHNYFYHPGISGVPANEWYKLKVPLASLRVYGRPDLSNITSFRIYVRGLEIGQTYEIFVDNIIAYSESYRIKR